MIYSRTELAEYLSADRKALRAKRKRPKLWGQEIWKFQICLRKSEYYASFGTLKKLLHLPLIIITKIRFHRLSLLMCLHIPLNIFGKGLSIAHYGNIAVNDAAVVGENCRIHEGVTIGATSGSSKAPRIGNNVFIGSGAKIIGDITIADNVAIGANAVVVKSITEPDTTWGGIPAKKISDKSSREHLSPELFK